MRKGFTLIEFMIVMFFAVIFFIFVLAAVVSPANCWYTEKGVERQLRGDADAQLVTKTERNIFRYSKVWYRTTKGEDEVVCLDSNMLFDYKLFRCDEE